MVEPYLAALLHEIEACAEMAREMGLHIRVGYIGGGTPSSLTTPQLDRLLAHVERHFGALAEFTVEAGRPDTLDAQKLRMIHDHPVTRISINPQTMNDATLTRIGRAHTAKQTVEAYELARSIGFDDINMDVIAALPGEDYAMFAHTLAEIRRLRPESLTVHTLAIKRSSRLHEENTRRRNRTPLAWWRSAQTAHDMGMRASPVPAKIHGGKHGKRGLRTAGAFLPIQHRQHGRNHQHSDARRGGISKCVMREEKILRAPNIANIEQYIDRVDERSSESDRLC
ncbi:MAG: radical SAM protein [Christensenellales bacterium]